MKSNKKDINRNRKNKNLSGLYAITSDIAYKNGKLRKEVFGVVSKSTPYITKPKTNNKPRTFVRNMSEIPDACKNRILAFYDDKTNLNRNNCYLAEKSLYLEMIEKQKKK